MEEGDPLVIAPENQRCKLNLFIQPLQDSYENDSDNQVINQTINFEKYGTIP